MKLQIVRNEVRQMRDWSEAGRLCASIGPSVGLPRRLLLCIATFEFIIHLCHPFYSVPTAGNNFKKTTDTSVYVSNTHRE